jgi:2-hydroxychromene-2-carboxylate isomerase
MSQTAASAPSLKKITCYFDFISPYAYLAFEHLPKALEGISYAVRYKPVLFAGLLKHHGQLGPAEIAPKRDWTYRQVLWLAQRHGIDLTLPTSHPFNPLGLLRLAVACDAQGLPNRYVTETIFRHVWCSGEEASDAARLAQLTVQLAPTCAPDSDAVKAQLKANTEEAIAKGLFGVPTFEVDGKLFWGLDALPMLRDYLTQHAWFAGEDWAHAASIAQGVRR